MFLIILSFLCAGYVYGQTRFGFPLQQRTTYYQEEGSPPTAWILRTSPLPADNFVHRVHLYIHQNFGIAYTGHVLIWERVVDLSGLRFRLTYRQPVVYNTAMGEQAIDVYYGRPLRSNSYIGWSFSQSSGPISMDYSGTPFNGSYVMYANEIDLVEDRIYNASFNKPAYFSFQAEISPSWSRIGPPGELGNPGLKGPPGEKGAPGSPGVQGQQGIQGASGVKGVKGDTGANGLFGDTGDSGSKGIKGDTGSAGQKGDKGEQGDPGPPGNKGQEGTKGLFGSKGSKGDKGADGDQGSQGAKGPMGPKGEKGSSGDKGFVGIKGPKGTTGEKGDKGPKGPPGPGDKGDPGVKGVDGPKGPPGAQGDKGQKGDTGYKGEPGASGPAGSKGIPGTGQGPTGPQGPQGVVGDKGPKGDTGDQGPPGDDSVPGPPGPPGPPGGAGDKGDKGSDGATGETGDTGDQGPPGPQGDKGDKGDKGNKGVTGDKGDIGPKGDDGPEGSTGPTGAPGFTGIPGPQGFTGPDGTPGDKGDKGSKGVMGPTGSPGGEGATGPKGDTGNKGEMANIINYCSTGNGGCDHICRNLFNSSSCTCYSGYRLQADRQTCVDVDECTEINPCQYGCLNVPGSYNCTCPEGYAPDYDVNGGECHKWELVFKATTGAPFGAYNLYANNGTMNENNAAAQALNNDTAEHFKSGIVNTWEQENVYKVKVALYENDQQVSYFLFDGRGTTRLSWFNASRLIRSSYDLMSVFPTQAVLDMDGSITRPSQRFNIINPSTVTLLVSCLDNVWLSVTDFNDGGSCGFQLSTTTVYRSDGAGPSGVYPVNWATVECMAIFIERDNLCSVNNGGCSHICYNMGKSRRCSCPTGLALGADYATCSDIDECVKYLPCSHICDNTQGGFTCSCRDGYELSNVDNSSCTDIDECATPDGAACRGNEMCINTAGSFTCLQSLISPPLPQRGSPDLTGGATDASASIATVVMEMKMGIVGLSIAFVVTVICFVFIIRRLTIRRRSRMDRLSGVMDGPDLSLTTDITSSLTCPSVSSIASGGACETV